MIRKYWIALACSWQLSLGAFFFVGRLSRQPPKKFNKLSFCPWKMGCLEGSQLQHPPTRTRIDGFTGWQAERADRCIGSLSAGTRWESVFVLWPKKSWLTKKHVEKPSFFVNIFRNSGVFSLKQLISGRNLVFWYSSMWSCGREFSIINRFFCVSLGRPSMCFSNGLESTEFQSVNGRHFDPISNFICQWSAEVSFAHGFHPTIRLFWCRVRKGKRLVCWKTRWLKINPRLFCFQVENHL